MIQIIAFDIDYYRTQAAADTIPGCTKIYLFFPIIDENICPGMSKSHVSAPFCLLALKGTCEGMIRVETLYGVPSSLV